MAKPMLKMLVPLILFVVVAIPLVAFLWGSLNEILAWEIGARRALITVITLAVFGVVVMLWARKAKRL